jgi:S-disulfanyl-L-cysteine oxidoreductase SoxD
MGMKLARNALLLATSVWVCALSGARAQAPARSAAAKPTQTPLPARLGIGRAATPAEIAAWDIDIMPDGTGLPPGRGTALQGATIFASRCAGCHGKTGKEGPNDVLVGREPRDGFPFSQDPTLPHTIGNYWPYATTVFDYIRRAMPPDAPGSLTDTEVYSLTAFLLHANELILPDAVIDATTLPKVAMPARDRFVPDTRPHTKPRP